MGRRLVQCVKGVLSAVECRGLGGDGENKVDQRVWPGREKELAKKE